MRPACPASAPGDRGPVHPQASTASPLLAEILTTVNVSGGYFEIQDFLVRLRNLVKRDRPGASTPVGADRSRST
jgi:hypothetical protein